MYSTRIVVDIIDCLSHRSQAIRMKAEKMSDIVLENDRKPNGEIGPMGKEVVRKRFDSYNKMWINNVLNQIDNEDDSGEYYGDRILSQDNLDPNDSMTTTAKYYNERVCMICVAILIDIM